MLPGPPSLPPGRRCWGRTPRPPPGVGAASASPDSTVRPFGGSWSEDAMCRVCLRHYCFARGHAGKGMQARDISRLVPGQGLSVRLWAGYCVALTHRPQPLCQRGSRCLFHKRFSGGHTVAPGVAATRRPPSRRQQQQQTQAGSRCSPRPAPCTPPSRSLRVWGGGSGPPAGIGAEPPSPTLLSPPGRRGTESADRHWPRIWEVPHVAPEELGHVTEDRP